MQSAPFFQDVSKGPENVRAHWLTTSDGVNIRVGVWPTGAKGTVLLLPGRTEYIEKYGPAAGDLRDRGYATMAIDWRGQGLSARLLENRAIGYVGRFSDYQFDVKAMVRAAGDLGLPRPFYLMSHSMGGAIALRALIDGIGVRAAVFSAPMWGIRMSPFLRPFALALSALSGPLGFGGKLSPGTTLETYVKSAPFLDNTLTTDTDMFAFMNRQVTTHPDLALGGPSLHWLHEALSETRYLERKASPDTPSLTFIGTNERIVDTSPITRRMTDWPRGTVLMADKAEHEVMMEGPAIRKQFFDAAAALFDAHR
jgi:lysophospholipase